MKLGFLLFALLYINGYCSGQTKLKDIDSSSLSVLITTEKYSARIQDQRAVVGSKRELEKFIKKNKTLIEGKKVFIIGSGDLQFGRVKPVLDLIKKYNLYKFEMIVL